MRVSERLFTDVTRVLRHSDPFEADVFEESNGVEEAGPLLAGDGVFPYNRQWETEEEEGKVNQHPHPSAAMAERVTAVSSVIKQVFTSESLLNVSLSKHLFVSTGQQGDEYGEHDGVPSLLCGPA